MCGVHPRDSPSTEQTEEGNEFRRNLMYLSMKIAQMSDRLPESIFITGVRLKSTTPVGGGAFADIYYGEYQGKLVAIKRLRDFLADTEADKEKTSRVRLLLSYGAGTGYLSLPYRRFAERL